MKKAFAIVATWAMAVGAIVVLVSPGAKAAVFTGSNQFSGYSTGTLVHADLLQLGTTRLVNAEVGFSGAAADTTGLASAVNNEMSDAVSPAQPNKNSYGRGSGLELGLASSLPNNPDLNQLILAGLAEASAPPSTPLVTKEVGPIPANPLLYATLLRGQAEANFDPNACVTDPTNLSFGLGQVGDVQLLNTGAANPDGSMTQPVIATDIGTPTDRAVGQAKSFMHLVPNGDGTFGLVSETHETVAPITLFKGTANEIRIELLGEWVLTAKATGQGPGTVTYAPAGNTQPTTPLVRITTPGSPVANVLTAQAIFGAGGLHIPIPTLADIFIGEPARAIGSSDAPTPPIQTTTTASGAVDVVRVKLVHPDPTTHVSDIRIGHMEANAQVPTGGIACPAAAATTTSTSPSSSTSTSVPATTSTTTAASTTSTTAANTTTSTTAPSTTTSTTTAPAPGACFYNGYSTGSDVHADLLQLPGPNPTMRLVNADLAFSGAAANTSGLSKPINNEMQNAVSPALPAKDAYGRGSGLELGLGTALPNNPDINQLILAGLAEASAPPSTSLVTKEVGPIPGNPLIYASLLRGQAQAQFGPTPVSVTDPNNVAFGLGYAADAQLLNTGAANPDGSMQQPVVAADIGTPTDRSAVQAKSFLHLVPNADGTFGLQSETHETFVPVTLFKGTANEIRIELLGEWVLRATATGKLGGATITYAPAGNPSPTTPLIAITPPGGATQIVLKTQQLFGPGALPQHIDIPTLASINIGEDPRAIGSDNSNPAAPTAAGDGTLASGAVDVVRVNLLHPDPTSHLADVRIGHMEAQAQVPGGGINCPNVTPAIPTTTSTVAATTSTTAGAATTSTTSPPAGTTTTTAAPSSTTTTAPFSPAQATTTTTAAPTTTTAAPTTTTTAPFRPSQATTTTTEPPTTTSTAAPFAPSQATTTTTSTTAPPQVQAQTFTQSPPAVAVNQTPSFTG